MTRTSEQAQAEREQYGLRARNPHYNTAVARLQSKLRNLKLFEENPHFVEFIVDDLIWYYFRGRGRNKPQSLWRLLQRIQSYWNSSLMPLAPPQSEDDRQNYFTQFGILSEDEPEKVSLPPGAVLVHFESKGLKAQSSQVILDHAYMPTERKGIDVPTCACGKEFEFIEQWATHARLRIWKGLGYEPQPRTTRESSPHG